MFQISFLFKASTHSNPLDKVTMVDTWRQALGLSMGPINQDRLADGLPALTETDPSLTALAQATAEKFAAAGKFIVPDFSGARPNVLVVAMTLRGDTRINEYDFLINDSKYFYIKYFKYCLFKYDLIFYKITLDK